MNQSKSLVQSLILTALAAAGATTVSGADWKTAPVSPVTNPVFFEDPNIRTEIRPIFLYHNMDENFLAGEGRAILAAAQLRWAVNDRLAVIATKDGYVDIEFDDAPGLSHSGWADLAFGLKYALIRSDEHKFVLTPGLTFEIPTGDDEVFQGNGDGEWNPFVSAAKGWGNFRILGNVGGRIPNNQEEETAQLHYSLQFDYNVCQWFVPFVSINAFTVLTEGENPLPLDEEGFDLINFGAPDAGGHTQAAAGVGFRSRLHKNAELGFAYERGLDGGDGFFDDRFTVDLIVHF